LTAEKSARSNTAPKSRKGLVQVFTGDGKGKTTAALGMALRALGHDMKVFVAVFMKGDYPYGEWEALARFPNITVARFGFRTFTDPKNVKPEEREQARLALAAARDAMLSRQYDLVILDEVNVAVGFELIPVEDVVSLINERPPQVELILTGRRANAKLVELADLVTECVKVKHPFDQGTRARPGIEY